MYINNFTLFSSQACLPYLKQSKNPHILNISPPLSMKPVWFMNHTGRCLHFDHFLGVCAELK